jgi:hypothetical protein
MKGLHVASLACRLLVVEQGLLFPAPRALIGLQAAAGRLERAYPRTDWSIAPSSACRPMDACADLALPARHRARRQRLLVPPEP